MQNVLNISQVREIVAKIAKIPARNIKLSNEPMSPNFVPQEDRGHSWWDGASTEYDVLYFFNPTTGFKEIKDMSTDYSYSYNGNVTSSKGETLESYCERTNNFPMFILRNHYGKEYGENGVFFKEWILYPSPHLQEFLKTLEDEDRKRWASWFKNILS